VDLHLHTIFSDGVFTPEEIVARALARQLTAIAITDHDSVEGIERAQARARDERIEVIPALELSATEADSNVHLLGYYVDPAHEPLRRRLTEFRSERRERARAMAEKLRGLGAPVDLDEIYRIAEPGAVGRPHVAEALVRAGHVRDVEDAFRRFVGYRAPAYVPRVPFAPAQAIALVGAAGGVAALAHPGSLRRDDLIPGLVERGLRAIEVWHPNHDASAVRRYQEFAKRFGLIETGGSDYHGPNRGSEIGQQPVPESTVERLKQAAGKG
jgi:predicted metal-dependent phosphoesterase TrpH